MTCGRKKAFIGAVVGAGLGVAKGVAGIISKRKQAQKQQQQDYINTVLQARGAMTTDLNNNESLQEDFESKYVMKCGGHKRSACGKAVRMACGGKKACGGRKKALDGLSTGMQLGSMVGDIGQMFVKGAKKTEAPAISTRTQRLTNLNQAGTNSVQSPTNNVVTTNTNSAAPIPTIPLSNNPDSNLKRCGGKQAKFGTSRRRCGLGISLAYKSSRNKQTR